MQDTHVTRFPSQTKLPMSYVAAVGDNRNCDCSVGLGIDSEVGGGMALGCRICPCIGGTLQGWRWRISARSVRERHLAAPMCLPRHEAAPLPLHAV